MSTAPSRKRGGGGGGDKSSEDPPRKIPPSPVVDGRIHDVVLIVKGQKFCCLKEKLAEHSTFFERMFFSGFVEKNKDEVEIGEVDPDVFQLFIDAMNGINSMTDEYSEVALVAAIFLGSTTFENKILEHLAGNSEITLQEQFKMAEDHKSNGLMSQVFASVKDKYELDEVLPKNLDSLCNSTKNLVMQKSLELLGIRKPPSPPLPEDPDEVFESRMNQLIDQIEVQNHHGEVLRDQVELLLNHMVTEVHFSRTDNIAEGIVREEPLVKELLDQLRNAHEQDERNFIQAQIQVLTFKHIYKRAKNKEIRMEPDRLAFLLRDIPAKLHHLSTILNGDKRSQSRSHKVTLGNGEIDEIYRTITARVKQQNQVERPRNTDENATWLKRIHFANERLANAQGNSLLRRPIPDGLRNVPNRASFRAINEVVSSMRRLHYGSKRVMEPENNGGGEDDGPDQVVGDQNPLEQERN